MKKTRFFVTLLCLAIASTMAIAESYTSFLTSERGFTEVTSTDGIIASADYYYILTAAENTELFVGIGIYEGKPDWASMESKALRYRSANTDPVLDLSNFFTIEKSGGYIGLRNVVYASDLFQTHDGAGYMYVNTFTDKNLDEWSYLTPTYQNGYWLFESGKYPMSSGNWACGYLGPWNKNVAAGEPIALNRRNETGDEAGHYHLYRIAKAKLMSEWSQLWQAASATNVMDVTWMVANPSFETGDVRGWTYVAYNGEGGVILPEGYNDFGAFDHYPMTNKDGQYLLNAYQWWCTSMSISQTVLGLPSGEYELSGVVCTWEGREVTFSGNQTTVTTTGINDATGIPVSMNIAIGNNKRLTISAGSTGQWWVNGHEGETQTFFKLDNVQLKCKGLYLNAIAQPLPNDNTTLLLPNVWYYYDVDYPCEHWLIGHLDGMVYSTDGDKLIANVSTSDAAQQVTLPKGRVYFKTSSNDATLIVKPCREMLESEEFTAVALNVDGLPQKVATISLNPDGPGSDGTKKISRYLASKGYDFIGCSEDFNYHGSLMQSLEDNYYCGTHRGSLSIWELSIPFDTDGLELLWKKSTCSASNESWTRWTDRTDTDGNQYVKKGYRHYDMTIGGNTFDVYVLHMDAGEATNSREGQWRQLAAAINGAVQSRPKLIIGDTNSRWTREDIKANFMDLLNSNLTASDAWVEFCRDGVYPTTDMGDLTNQDDPTNYSNYEVVDKIIYINPTAANTLQLIPQSFRIEQDYTYGTVDGTNDTKPLGDHRPVVVAFKLIKSDELIDYYDVTIGDAKFATLSLPWNATIPSGVTAYTSDCYHADNHQIDLQEVNEVIPAGTGVILYSDTPDTYRFYYNSSNVDKITENILKGTECGRLESTDRDNDYTYYVLANKAKGVGMYRLGNNTAIPQYRAYLKLSSYDANPNNMPVEHVRFFANHDEDWVSEDGGFIDAINRTSTDESTIINIHAPNGIRLDKIQKGVNIVRMRNGVTKKIIK
ncbi:MAG: hypothetical protein II052_00620 [Prevotella sp.]|nr:hypothetical protein [Prevotella sp.]